MSISLEELRYPIGRYENMEYSEKLKQEWLNDIRFVPQLLENSVRDLDEVQLQTPYREGGWTVQQVVHHVADSHMNGYTRIKLALTETNPVIKPYDEVSWAELSDTKNLPINISLTLLHALHLRWVEILRNIKEEEWSRTAFHPEHKKTFTVWQLFGNYAWHGKHHTAHITSLRDRMSWK